ncbi:MAG: divergent PAP2 family protein [Treponema sp.]|jgi:acid phosphatase family membrane protein YuiD|nr:divergent PAP2 family protein [Treponema sp.]
MSGFFPLRAAVLKAFLENPIFLSSVTSWFMAQLIKAMIVLLNRRKKNFRELLEVIIWRTGGMPSSHAALVCAMVTSIGFAEGVGSNLFVVSFFFAIVVMRDAVGVRRSSGLQARALNNLGSQMLDRMDIDFRSVKEVNGHTPLEVVVGALLGIFTAAAFALL